MAVFNIGTGFCSSLVPFTVLRGLCGVGGALITPNAAALLGKQYPAHSHRRTVGFGVLGALAPIGFNVGAAMASLIVERLNAQWIFWIACVPPYGLSLSRLHPLLADKQPPHRQRHRLRSVWRARPARPPGRRRRPLAPV